jgi:transposase-like protein
MEKLTERLNREIRKRTKVAGWLPHKKKLEYKKK